MIKLEKSLGYIVDKSKFNSSRDSSDLSCLLTELVTEGITKEAERLVLKLSPIQIAAMWLTTEVDGLADLLARVSAYSELDYLWEFVCHQVVLGTPPYPTALDLGLTEDDIESYQLGWREIGVEPTLIKWITPLPEKPRYLIF